MRQDHRQAIREARDIYRRRDVLDEEMLERAVSVLAGHKIWSMSQVRQITGAKSKMVRDIMQKTSHTGGKLNPQSFDLMLEEIELADRNDSNPLLTLRIVESGTSGLMLSRLIGQSVATVNWRARRGREMRG